MDVLIEFAILLVVAGVCGFFASQLMGAKRMNIIVMVILGFIGAAVGRFLAHFLHLPMFYQMYLAGHSFPIVWAFIGSLLTVGIASWISQH